MKNIKKLTVLILAICMVISLLSGCTSVAEGKALYDAIVKSQSIKSYQNDMELVIRLDAEGLSDQDKAQFEQVKAMLNGAKLTMKMKQAANADNTVSKVQANTDMYMAGMSMNMGVWVDMDLNSSSPKFKEVIKLPAVLTESDPTMAGKEYMVMDIFDMMNANGANDKLTDMDFESTMKLTTELQEKTTAFITKYLLQYDPGFKLITDVGTKNIVTPERTVNAHVYQVKLDDKTAKKLIRYTVNNLADNKDAMDFVTEYMTLIQKFSAPTQGLANPTVEFDKIMSDFENEKPGLLAEFNKAMDQIENIKLIGEKGITLEYAIDENGYIVSQSGSMDFIIDIAQLNNIEGISDNYTDSTGVYSFGFDYSMLTYNVNKALNIEMPTLTSANSINYADIMKTVIIPEPAKAQKATPTTSKVLVNGKAVSFDAYTIDGNNYFKLRDLAKIVKGTGKQFEVTWNGEKRAINLISNKAYTLIGSEMAKGDGKEKTPIVNTSRIYKDGVEVSLIAYTINGNNYFKLRDVAQSFNIGITWNEAARTIGIDTTTGYVAP